MTVGYTQLWVYAIWVQGFFLYANNNSCSTLEQLIREFSESHIGGVSISSLLIVMMMSSCSSEQIAEASHQAGNLPTISFQKMKRGTSISSEDV